ncbi:MAG: response regulator [Acidobacteriaceae bacterium]
MAQGSESQFKGRILVIDDQDASRYVFRRILNRAGYAVEEAATGEEGLQKAMCSPDLIIADVNLPDMLGYDVCRRLKANPVSASIPVLQISASFLSNESKIQALEGGADSYLAQPIEPTMLVAQVQALMRLRKVEALSHLTARQWQTTFDALSDGLALADSDRVVLRANRAFLRLLSLKSSEVEGCGISHIFQSSFQMPLPEFSRDDASFQFSELPAASNWFRVRYDKIPGDSERDGGSILLITDITDQKKLHETLKMSERLAATGRLAHTIAHEINNPLEALSNLIYIAQEKESTNSDTQSYLRQASIELDRVSQITKQILAYHRDSKRPIPVAANELIDSVLAMFRAPLSANRVTLSKRLASSRLISVHPGETRQAFGNLIANALDAMSASGGKLIVRCFDATDERSQRRGVRIVLSDSGAGIPQSAYAHIFDAFYTTKELHGSGVGLWLTSEVIAKHGGRIRLRSRTEGRYRGTLFDVFLPEHTES